MLHIGKKTILLHGANRIGKTLFGACIVGSACLGYQPWDNAETIWGGQPVRVRIICEDWEHHAAEVIVPELKRWLPEGAYQTRKNNVGVEAHWFFPKTKSTIELLTHGMETKLHEGWKGHLVWADEPLPYDKYIANRRGLVDFGGVFLLTLTALSEPWIFDRIASSSNPRIGAITNIPMRANIHLNKQEIQDFEDELDEQTAAVRVYGGWMAFTDLVLPEFDRDKHIIDPFKVPVDYPVVPLIDIALSKKQAVGFYAWDKMGIEFVVDEFWSFASPEEIAQDIVRRKKANLWSIAHAYIDPLAKGDSKYMRHRADVEDSFSIIHRILARYGIRLEPASKDKDSGVLNLKAMLKGPNKIPTTYICRNCERHIWEIQRWQNDPDTGKPKKGLKVEDDMMENYYRSTLTGVSYMNALQYTFGGNKRLPDRNLGIE